VRDRRSLTFAVVVSLLLHGVFALSLSATRVHLVTNGLQAGLPLTVVSMVQATSATKPPPVTTEPVMQRQPKPVEARAESRSNPPRDVPAKAPEPAKRPPRDVETGPPRQTNTEEGPFVSPIDRSTAWMNVAEVVNYELLRGVPIDVSNGEYRLSTELDVRVRARGDLVLEYPVDAALLGEEGAVYIMLLIDEQGAKRDVRVLNGKPVFAATVLRALEPIQFTPGRIRGNAVRSILLLEFDFRREPPPLGVLL
jgi:outer membrane biosynthesis protein TonB